jgi:hypothetical protein
LFPPPPRHFAALEKERAAHALEKEEKLETIARLKDQLQQLKNDVATRRKFAAKEVCVCLCDLVCMGACLRLPLMARCEDATILY